MSSDGCARRGPPKRTIGMYTSRISPNFSKIVLRSWGLREKPVDSRVRKSTRISRFTIVLPVKRSTHSIEFAILRTSKDAFDWSDIFPLQGARSSPLPLNHTELLQKMHY